MMPAHRDRAPRDGPPLEDSEREREVLPVGMSRDGTRVIVTAYKGGDTRGSGSSTRGGAPGEKVFVHPEFDVEGVLEDPLTGDSSAPSTTASGERAFTTSPSIPRPLPLEAARRVAGRPVAIVSGTADRQVFAFLDASDQNPGDFYLRDPAGQVHRVGR